MQNGVNAENLKVQLLRQRTGIRAYMRFALEEIAQVQLVGTVHSVEIPDAVDRGCAVGPPVRQHPLEDIGTTAASEYVVASAPDQHVVARRRSAAAGIKSAP